MKKLVHVWDTEWYPVPTYDKWDGGNKSGYYEVDEETLKAYDEAEEAFIKACDALNAAWDAIHEKKLF